MPFNRVLGDVSKLIMEPLVAAMPRLEKLGWRLINQDFEQGICLTFERNSKVIFFEFEPLNAARDAYSHTVHFNTQARDPFRPTALSEVDRAFSDAVIRLIEKGFSAMPHIDRPAISRNTEAREILVDSVLMPEGRNQYYINPYVGCTMGCNFCYVIARADFSRGIEGLPCLKWGHYVDVKVNAPEILSHEIKQHPRGIVRISPILTDPYQPVERKYRITRKCLEILRGGGFTPVILTRSGLVTEDIGLLKSFDGAAVGFSIPTDDDKYRKIFESGASPIEERFDALRQCAEAGLTSFVCIQPIYPMNVDRLLDKIAPYVHSVRIDRMQFVDNIMDLYVDSGLEFASTEEFFDETEKLLMEGLRKRGIPTYEFDDMEILKQ